MTKQALKTETDFTIKGEQIGIINLTDSFSDVKKLVNHSERQDFTFITTHGSIISHFDLYRAKENVFPIKVIKSKRDFNYDESEVLYNNQ